MLSGPAWSETPATLTEFIDRSVTFDVSQCSQKCKICEVTCEEVTTLVIHGKDNTPCLSLKKWSPPFQRLQCRGARLVKCGFTSVSDYVSVWLQAPTIEPTVEHPQVTIDRVLVHTPSEHK